MDVGLCCCTWASSSRGEWRLLSNCGSELPTEAASLVAKHSSRACGLRSCGTWAQLPNSMWNLPRPGIEAMSPALAGRFLTTGPSGKPPFIVFLRPHLLGFFFPFLAFFLKNTLLILCQFKHNKMIYILSFTAR